MDVRDYVKYLLFVEEVGHQLEQRALDGDELPPVLNTRTPGSYSQRNLGVHVTFEPAGRFGPTPHVPAVFPLRRLRIRGSGCFNIPEVAAVRFIIAQFDTGMRTAELISATHSDGGRCEIQDSYRLTLPARPRLGQSNGSRVEFHSATARMLTRELEVRHRTGVASPQAFARLDGRALTPAAVTLTKTVMWEAFLFEFGVPRDHPRPNPRIVKFSELLEGIGHPDGGEAAKYYLPTTER
jgi:hypothetical protein